MGLDDAIRLIDHFCCTAATAAYGPYRRTPEPGEELLSGTLYRFRLVEGEARPRPVDAQVFLGLSDLGGLLWEQQVQALIRLNGMAHPALPDLLDGGYEEAADTRAAGADVGGAAFVFSAGAERSLSPALVDYYRRTPLEALRQFVHLADGLSMLHEVGLAHRNLWPGAVNVVRTESDEAPDLRLARFEMSTFVSSLLSGVTVDTAAAHDELRALVLGQGVDPLAYLPPERLDFLLFSGSPDAVPGSDLDETRADVYCLAAMVAEWFLPESGLHLPADVPAAPAARAELRSQLEELHTERVRRLMRSALPRQLVELLRAMLGPASSRPSGAEVSNELARANGPISIGLGEESGARPHLVAFMPNECKKTLYLWPELDLRYPPDTEEGAQDLAELIVTDLRKGMLTHSPDGANGFVSGSTEKLKRDASTVLIGDRVVWFCQPLRRSMSDVPGEGGLRRPIPQILVIKFVAERSRPDVERRLENLRKTAKLRRLPEVLAIDYLTEEWTLRELLRDRPSWRPLTDTVQPLTVDSPGDLAYKSAIDWLLEYQGVELRARQYPFIRDEPEEGQRSDRALVSWDSSADLRRIHRSALFNKYAKNRPPLGLFFRGAEFDEGAEVEILPGEAPWPARHRGTVRAYLDESAGRDRVFLRPKDRRFPIPERGWLRPASDRGTEVALRRQIDARWELFRNRALLTQLRAPRSIRTLPHRWAGAGEKLKGNGPEAVQRMLTYQPLFAIQGPPGTGKSTVTAHAIAAYLRQEPARRILISAQSNYALDNLAVRILGAIGALGEDGPVRESAGVPIALRSVSRRLERGDKNGLDSRVAPWTRHSLAVRRAVDIREHVGAILSEGVDPAVRPILERWRGLLDSAHGESVLPELADRLQRGANLVFATCSGSTLDGLGMESGEASFDWVIVEEAAKAWPTELVIPLVRGTRWTLVGDHRQLSAHRRTEVVRFLESCVDDPNPEIGVLGERLSDYLSAFDLFRSLFQVSEERAARHRPPTLDLNTQFRMRRPIAEVISRVFYPADEQPPPGEEPADGLPVGGLQTEHDERPVPLTAPSWLRNRALVWLDTGGLGRCSDIPRWRNDGEVDVVASLVAGLRPTPKPSPGQDHDPLVVLTPYREQNEELVKRVELAETPVSTVHAYQGREAEIVVVSLVRDTIKPPPPGRQRQPWDGFGHLAVRDLANVLFSRARRLLVVVGDLQHFASHESSDPFWPLVCRAVRLNGAVVAAEQVFPELGEL